MAWTCYWCDHRSCMNGESGIGMQSECNKCSEFIMLCSNDLTDSEIEKDVMEKYVDALISL